MNHPLFGANTLPEEHLFPGMEEFHCIDRVTFGVGRECVTITPAATIGKKLPLGLGSCHHIFFFPDDHNPAEHVHGKLQKNGILLLKLTFKDGCTKFYTTTPPYTVSWATDHETDRASRGDIVGGKM